MTEMPPPASSNPPPPPMATSTPPARGALGKPRSVGLVILLTIVTFGIWTIVDFIMIVTGNFKDAEGMTVKSS